MVSKGSARRITPQTTLDNLKKEAKQRLKDLRARNTNPLPVLRDVQHAIALEFGMSGWTALKLALTSPAPAPDYNQLVRDMVEVYATGDDAALARINQHHGRSYTAADFRAQVWRQMYIVRRAKGAPESFQAPEAQEMIARNAGFPNWIALTAGASGAELSRAPIYSIDTKQNSISPARDLTDHEWDILLGVIKERRIATLHANGRMNDRILRRVVELDHVTSLFLEGCRELTDEGMLQLSRMPQLERLDHPSGALTDRGLEVLRHLPNLRDFKMVWAQAISDAGLANLKFCEKLEGVHLMGSATGDGAIAALRNKAHLRHLETGRLVTDAGLKLIRDIPQFRQNNGGEVKLLIDGPFSNQGLMAIAGLDGLTGLDLFWHATNITADGFVVLRNLPNLESLGCDGELCTDETMRHIAAAPRLQKLRAQGSAATDDGFIALSKSATLEEFWGREAPGLTGPGFIALSNMPRLRSLGISLKNVHDEALASLARFPALREITPIDVTDDGFRNVGQCIQLERLSCMYCRETTDIATEHIAGLQLKYYYAGLTKITDRSLEILGHMLSLEQIELFETKSVTDAGLAALANLPNLQAIELSGLPHVTYTGTKVFPPNVTVAYEL